MLFIWRSLNGAKNSVPYYWLMRFISGCFISLTPVPACMEKLTFIVMPALMYVYSKFNQAVCTEQGLQGSKGLLCNTVHTSTSQTSHITRSASAQQWYW